MKVFAGLVVAATATVDRIGLRNSWPANTDAPHCGCQMIIDPADFGGYINATCTIRFPYADQANRYGRDKPSDPHFVSIASTYMVGRERDNVERDLYGPDGFQFTGFDGVSNPDVLDILVFYENADCARVGRSVDEIPSLPQDQIWEVYNLTTSADGITDMGQKDYLCQFDLVCEQETQPSGIHLGNFNYDIARSVQTYTAPIYGLAQGESVTFDLYDYYDIENQCVNAAAHVGHGNAFGCYNNITQECSNSITFSQNPEHNGLLEYFQWEPVSVINAPACSDVPEHHEEDYQWKTPSPWDTQENFFGNRNQMTGPQNNQDYSDSL